MPTIAKDKEKQLKRIIRDAIAIDPLISLEALQNFLLKRGYKTSQGNGITLNYLGKLIKKIRKEAAYNIQNDNAIKRIAETRERYRLVYERLNKVAFYSQEMRELGIRPPMPAEIIKALETIVKLDLAILSAEITCGVFEKKQDPNIIDVKNELNSDQRESIQGVITKWVSLIKTNQKKVLKNKLK